MIWNPETYRATIRDEVHDYDALQDALVRAIAGCSPATVLELGVGAGETTRRILEAHPAAHLTGIDSSKAMLEGARAALPAARVTLLKRDLREPLPGGHFDLVVSVLAIHHLEGEQKRDLFERVAGVLSPGGRFAYGDVVVPGDPAEAVIENEPGYDFPSSVDDQLEWLGSVGLPATVVWSCGDLAVLRAGPAPPEFSEDSRPRT